MLLNGDLMPLNRSARFLYTVLCCLPFAKKQATAYSVFANDKNNYLRLYWYFEIVAYSMTLTVAWLKCSFVLYIIFSLL